MIWFIPYTEQKWNMKTGKIQSQINQHAHFVHNVGADRRRIVGKPTHSVINTEGETCLNPKRNSTGERCFMFQHAYNKWLGNIVSVSDILFITTDPLSLTSSETIYDVFVTIHLNMSVIPP